MVGGGRRTGPVVLRRRPEAVDLPLPPGGHRHVPAGPQRGSAARGRTADRQLPHHQTDPGMGQPHVRRGSSVQDGESQPAYVPLDPDRGARRIGTGGGVHRVRAAPRNWRGRRPAGGRGRRCRRRHSSGHRRWLARLRHQDRRWRPARWSDVAVLLPARTSLRALERALERRRHPVPGRDLLARLRDGRDPGPAHGGPGGRGSHRLAGGGRRPAHGRVRLRRRRPVHLAADARRPLGPPGPAPAAAPTETSSAQGLSWLGELHRERLWLAPSQVLERIVRERRLMEVAFVHPRPRDLWRRLRFVVDQCRAWEEAGGTTLREYLAWVRLQSAEGARVIETVLPETDDDAVRILTIHGAKGLEFPITVLSGLTTQLSRRQGGVQVLFPPGGAGRCISRRTWRPPSSPTSQPIEEQMDCHERLRLLYVAATRARDHLIVSVHRKEGLAELRRRRSCSTSLAGIRRWSRSWGRRRAGCEEAGARGVHTGAASEVASPDLPSLPTDGSKNDLPPLSRPAARWPCPPPGWPRRRPAPRSSKRWPASRRTRGTSTCRRGRRAGTAAPSAGPSTACCRRSTWRRARAGRGVRGPGRGRGRPREGGRDRGLLSFGAGVGRRRGGGPTPPLAGGLRRHPLWRWGARGVHRPALPLAGRAGRRRLQDRQLARRSRPSGQGRALPGPTAGVRPGRERRRPARR